MVYLPHSQHFSALVYLPWVNLHKCYSVVQKLYWFWWHSITWDQSDYQGEQWSVCSSSTMESHKETALIHRCVRVYWGDLVMLVVTANINCNYCLLFAHAIKLLIKTVSASSIIAQLCSFADWLSCTRADGQHWLLSISALTFSCLLHVFVQLFGYVFMNSQMQFSVRLLELLAQPFWCPLGHCSTLC